MQLNSQSIFLFIPALPCEEKLLFSITRPTDGAGVCVTFPVWLPEVAFNATPGVCSLIRTGISKVFPITRTEPGSLVPWVNGDQVHLISHQQIALTHLPCKICRSLYVIPILSSVSLRRHHTEWMVRWGLVHQLTLQSALESPLRLTVSLCSYSYLSVS